MIDRVLVCLANWPGVEDVFKEYPVFFFTVFFFNLKGSYEFHSMCTAPLKGFAKL